MEDGDGVGPDAGVETEGGQPTPGIVVTSGDDDKGGGDGDEDEGILLEVVAAVPVVVRAVEVVVEDGQFECRSRGILKPPILSKKKDYTQSEK